MGGAAANGACGRSRNEQGARRRESWTWPNEDANPRTGRSTSARGTDRAAGLKGGDGPPMSDYRHAATRKNNPPAKIAAEGTVPVVSKAQYAYNAHLPRCCGLIPAAAPTCCLSWSTSTVSSLASAGAARIRGRVW